MVSIAHVDEPAVERLLSEQRRYYSARAPEYDDWWFRRGRYALAADAREAWFAAGTGIWTGKGR